MVRKNIFLNHVPRIPLVLLFLCFCLGGVTGQAPDSTVPDGQLVSAGQSVVMDTRALSLALRFGGLEILGVGVDLSFLKSQGLSEWQREVSGRMTTVVAQSVQFRSSIRETLPDIQSGMLYLPAPDGIVTIPRAWIIYCKGTELKRYEVPSRNAGAESRMALVLAALGFGVWMPDYAGMGVSPGLHPYCDPESLARSCLDGLAAARSLLPSSMKADSHEIGKGIRAPERLYVLGYSEGGLAAMSVARAILDPSWPAVLDPRKKPVIPAGLELSGVYSMAAPLDLTDWFQDMTPSSIPADPVLALFLVMGQARANPDSVDPEAILNPSILGEVVPWIGTDRSHGELWSLLRKALGIEVVAGKPSRVVLASDIFQPAWLALPRVGEGRSGLLMVLEQARMDQWVPPPGFPLTLAASREDRLVPFRITAAALARFSALAASRGEKPPRFLELSSGSHTRAGIEALLYTVMDVDQTESRQYAARNGGIPRPASSPILHSPSGNRIAPGERDTGTSP